MRDTRIVVIGEGAASQARGRQRDERSSGRAARRDFDDLFNAPPDAYDDDLPRRRWQNMR